ncbi:GerA spore germination protein [Paenibacillus curdlanolyticus YK9]|uniref:GerA spore germination protein n=1 Tax=Paenibacillus curdlanolyticus YK9 TaxID=717606 RepID=E0I3W8_9BACL|nr:spore germination protein [Paenibacillus curdlanolyticus]EFM12982.1 GerA spore germination protein [Paenibacillus curdlanolyticus YK9]
MFGKRSKDDGNTPLKSRKQIHSKTPLAANMAANLQTLSEKLGGSSDFVIRQLRCDAMPGVEMAVAYIKGIVEEETIHDNVVNPVMSWSAPLGKGSWTETLRQRIVTTGYTKPVSLVEDALNKLLDGECLIFTNGLREAVAADTSGGEQRSVAEPNTQTVIRGPQYSFTENISTNVGLLRRIIRSPDFRIRTYTVGRKTRTRVELLYVHNIANPKVVEEIDKRIRDIDIDGILESNYIEEFISDQTFTPFPTMMNTERPDTAAAAMLDGQLIILVDGTPFVLVGPATFFHFFRSAEDNYQRFDISTFLRLLRYCAFLVSVILPSLFIAITTFHQEMLPTTLLISLAAQREGIPFPALVEALLMELTFETLREAGVRMPRAIGPAISIVGALVLGQSAVQAGVVSPAMVIVVSFTAISNFVTPQISMATASRLIRFTLMLLAGFLGIFGIMAGLLFLVIHMTGLRSFGVPYMSPYAPVTKETWLDMIVRMPWWARVYRLVAISSVNPHRQRGGRPRHQK